MISRYHSPRRRFGKQIKIGAVVVLVIFFAVTFSILLYFRGYERSIKVKKDAFISEYYPDNNYGIDDYLRVGNYYYQKFQTYYYFDISSLPDGWDEANIMVNFDYGSDIVDVGANLTYEDWDEMSITWNNKPTKSIYRGHILCDGFDFRIPLRPDQIINDGVSVCLYGKGGEEDGYIQGYSKEGATRSDDIAWIELSYLGIDPAIVSGLVIGCMVILIIIFFILVIFFIFIIRSGYRKKPKKKNAYGADWIKANIGAKNQIFKPDLIKANKVVKKNIVKPDLIKANIAAKKKFVHPDWIEAELLRYSRYRPPPTLEKKINQYITLKLEYGRTHIYINGRRFLQCIRLVLDIPKKDVRLYDKIESIDEAAELYDKHLYQNRVVTGPLARPVPDQTHDITPEQEFWAHCSNIQAWVEHDYDTRILKSNMSFPLLRELSRVGDPLAMKVFREEIALRLESGYPSVVQYLLNQGYIKYLSISEFKTILETTQLIENISKEPKILKSFLQSCAVIFPSLFNDILSKILMFPGGKKSIITSISITSQNPYFKYNPRLLVSLYRGLEDLLGQDDYQLEKDVIDCISITGKLIEEGVSSPTMPNINQKYPFLKNQHFIDVMPEVFKHLENKLKGDNQFLHRFYQSQPKCSYCGKMVPKGSDTCYSCGHKKDKGEREV